MAGEISFEALGDQGLTDQFGAALMFGANNSYITPRTSDTVTTDAINGSAPIDNTKGSGWTGFFQDLVKAGVGYGIAKDAQRSNVVTPINASQMAAQQAQAQARPRWLVPALLAGGVVLAIVLVKKGG